MMNANSCNLRRAVFLDRDGTINVEKDYLYKTEDFEFVWRAPEAIKLLKDAGFLVIVVTNQSGVARGYYSGSDVDLLHAHVQDELAKVDACVDAFYVCPHHPTEGAGQLGVSCDCRKPQAGMLFRAAKEWDIDLEKSFIIGDKLADIEAGRTAGCESLLVKTGYGEEESRKINDSTIPVFNSIEDASEFIVNKTEPIEGSEE